MKVKSLILVQLLAYSALSLVLVLIFGSIKFTNLKIVLLSGGENALVYNHEEITKVFIGADKTNTGHLKKNIWNIEETFLTTPFFDGRRSALPGSCQNRFKSNEGSKSKNRFKFKTFLSPSEASSENMDLSQMQFSKNLSQYYQKVNGTNCLIAGTDFKKSQLKNSCICHYESHNHSSLYFGPHCDVPGSVWKVPRKKRKGFEFKIRSKPRRVVMGLVVDHELELTEIRVRQLHQVVDIFVILESNITAGGDPKPLYFFNAFSNGFLCEFQDKILYVYLDNIPDDYIKDGWLADDFLRNSMSKSAMSRIQNLDDEDLFLSFDADEIPKTEVVSFLKHHDGFHNILQFNLKWSVYTFYWKHLSNLTKISVGCTIDFLRQVCEQNVMLIRKTKQISGSYAQKLSNYTGPKGDENFQIGVEGDFAGFHCSWCTSPEGVSVKLRSAIHQDFPRWGDYPDKLDLSYLSYLIKSGLWFDSTKPVRQVDLSQETDFAPDFVLNNAQKYRSLLIQD